MPNRLNTKRFAQRGATLLEASFTLPLVIGVFVMAANTAQLLFRQSVFIDASNHTLRSMELSGSIMYRVQRCSQIIRSKVTEELAKNGVRTSENALVVTTTRIDPSKLKVTLNLYSDSIYGGLTMTQQTTLAIDQNATSCIEDVIGGLPGQVDFPQI